jgi:tetratricopeptide (TPR) repeat protein
MRLALILCVLPLPAMADCPPLKPEIGVKLDALHSELRFAPDPAVAQDLSGRLWAEWTRAPDARSQDLLNEVMVRRSAFDLSGALAAANALVDYCPAYAEGWNQRAFVNYIAGEHAAALPDLDRALALRPRHLGALTGKGLTLIALDRVAEGQEVIRAALRLNPWLAERGLLALDPEGGPADPSRVPEPEIEL